MSILDDIRFVSFRNGSSTAWPTARYYFRCGAQQQPPIHSNTWVVTNSSPLAVSMCRLTYEQKYIRGAVMQV